MVDRNASPSANGWFFQISAGMFLFLRDIKHNKTLNIEGESEDIEIETDSGMVYAQAKCLFDVNSRSSVYSHYKKALESIKDNKDKAIKLVYISNIQDPFNDEEDKYYDYETEYLFSQLKEKTQDKIRAKLGDDFDYNKLLVIIKHFYGTQDSKKKLLLEELSRFLINAVGIDNYKDQIYNKLITDGLLNATEKKYFVTKSKFVYTIILPYLESIKPNEEEIAIDADNYYYATEIYQSFLNSLEADYSNISAILSDFKNEKDRNNYNISEYTKKCSDRFIDMIPRNYDDEIRKELARILVFRILRQHFCLNNIKKAANL